MQSYTWLKHNKQGNKTLKDNNKWTILLKCRPCRICSLPTCLCLITSRPPFSFLLLQRVTSWSCRRIYVAVQITPSPSSVAEFNGSVADAAASKMSPSPLPWAANSSSNVSSLTSSPDDDSPLPISGPVTECLSVTLLHEDVAVVLPSSRNRLAPWRPTQPLLTGTICSRPRRAGPRWLCCHDLSTPSSVYNFVHGCWLALQSSVLLYVHRCHHVMVYLSCSTGVGRMPSVGWHSEWCSTRRDTIIWTFIYRIYISR